MKINLHIFHRKASFFAPLAYLLAFTPIYADKLGNRRHLDDKISDYSFEKDTFTFQKKGRKPFTDLSLLELPDLLTSNDGTKIKVSDLGWDREKGLLVFTTIKRDSKKDYSIPLDRLNEVSQKKIDPFIISLKSKGGNIAKGILLELTADCQKLSFSTGVTHTLDKRRGRVMKRSVHHIEVKNLAAESQAEIKHIHKARFAPLLEIAASITKDRIDHYLMLEKKDPVDLQEENRKAKESQILRNQVKSQNDAMMSIYDSAYRNWEFQKRSIESAIRNQTKFLESRISSLYQQILNAKSEDVRLRNSTKPVRSGEEENFEAIRAWNDNIQKQQSIIFRQIRTLESEKSDLERQRNTIRSQTPIPEKPDRPKLAFVPREYIPRVQWKVLAANEKHNLSKIDDRLENWDAFIRNLKPCSLKSQAQVPSIR